MYCCTIIIIKKRAAEKTKGRKEEQGVRFAHKLIIKKAFI
jgi:hypothetical protein